MAALLYWKKLLILRFVASTSFKSKLGRVRMMFLIDWKGDEKREIDITSTPIGTIIPALLGKFDPPPTNQQTDVKVNKGSYTSNHQQVSQILHISLKTIGHSSFYLSFLSIYKSTWYTICILYAYNGVTEISACIKNMYYIWVTSHLDGFKTKVFYSMNRKTMLKFVYVHALRNKSWFF